jgi:predicted DNA-binding transcriptional regulator AlpA
MKKFYTTKQVAKKIGVGYQTMLRWLYAKDLAEPERIIIGGSSVRLWAEADLQRARKYKVEGKAVRLARRGIKRPKRRK